MNGLWSIFVYVFIFKTYYCQEEQSNFLEGPNVCTRQESYNVTGRVQETRPKIVKKYVWCMKIPPRCSVYETTNETYYVDKPETKIRNVDECCEGYMVFGRRCVPVCSKGCGNGSCIAPEKCDCELGYTGPSCNEMCPSGKWGRGCTKNCSCNNATCNPFSGECICPPGRIGNKCEMKCFPESGKCICLAGSEGALCEKPCLYGYSDNECALECHCLNGLGCDPASGACVCPPGFTGLYCERQCEPGWYGEHCQNVCDCHNDASCDSVNGSCTCLPGYVGEKCQQKCPAGSYGENCLQKCDCSGADCNHITGECICPKHWGGKYCDQKLCPEGYFGSNCDQLCYCEKNQDKPHVETSVVAPGGFYHKKYNHTRIVEAKILTEEERLIFKHVMDGDYKSLADKCAQGVNMNIADIKNNNQTPLHLAAKKGCVFTMLTVMGCGVNINAPDGDGNTPLHVAVIDKQSHICSSLLYNEADPYISNLNMKTAYQLAMDSNDNWIKYIFGTNRLQWYKKVRKLKKGEKNLFLNVRDGYYGNVGDLCMKGVDVLVENVENKKNTAFHVAATYAQNIAPMVLTLLRCGGDINVRNADGNTPLHLAVIRGHFNATSTLLQYGANPFIENDDGKTPHDLAIESSDPSIQTIFHEPLLSWYLNTHFVF